jgi:hypothetical protein
VIIKEYETVDKFVAPRIKWLQYGFRDGLVKCPSSLNGFFFFYYNSDFTGVRRKTGSV